MFFLQNVVSGGMFIRFFLSDGDVIDVLRGGLKYLSLSLALWLLAAFCLVFLFDNECLIIHTVFYQKTHDSISVFQSSHCCRAYLIRSIADTIRYDTTRYYCEIGPTEKLIV